MTDAVTIFGVRHHGPGSSRSLVRTLEAFAPDILLIEGPPDAQKLIRFAAEPAMRPPVALIVYPRDRPGGGVFYPFASFSPEWNAIRYGLSKHVEVRFCDLPQAIGLAGNDREQPMEDEPVDPIALLSQAAGEADPERWWERVVEQRGDDADVFKAVLEAIAGVRETLPPPPLHEARREAHMRTAIRNARAEGFSRIGVVCGAWHAPALDALPPRKDDDVLLRGLKRIKVDATWVPWTASRLAYTSGYGAGVESPAWYRHLWETNGNLTAWLVAAARLLRDEDLDAAPAQVVDALRLAEALSALRGRPRPSLSEATDATLSVLCSGESARMRLIEQKLIIGEEMGALPTGVPTLPLQRDIDTQARRLRLRAVPEERALDLDLREPHALMQSRFLHRLTILGVDWGRVQPLPAGKLGTFHELWSLRWRPELALQVIEAAVYGTSLLEAACTRAIERAETLSDLGRTADLVRLVLLADLEQAVSRLLVLLSERSAESTDVVQMLRALPPLTSSLRYGDVRRTDATALAGVLRALAERAAVDLPPAAVGLDEAASESLVDAIVAATQSLSVLVDEAHVALLENWWATLHEVVGRRAVTPRIAGCCARLLLNAERTTFDEAEAWMTRALARGTPPADAATWLEGFLRPQQGGSGLILAVSPRLFGLVDDWLAGLPEQYFEQVLPLLRRTTSTFSEGERRQIAERVRSGSRSTLPGHAGELDAERAALVEPVVFQILGLRRD